MSSEKSIILQSSKDFMRENINDTLKYNKSNKRSHADTTTIHGEIDEIPNSERKCPTCAKKKKENVNSIKEIRGKLLEAMEGQSKTRNQKNDALLNGLSQVIGGMKKECKVLKSNQEKMQKLTAAFMKIIPQATKKQERKLTTLNEIHKAFKIQSEHMESEHKSQATKLADELEEDIKKLNQKLINETRRSSFQKLQKNIFQSLQNDF